MNSPRNIPRWSPIAWTLLAFLSGSACGDGGPALPHDGGGGQSDGGGPDANVVSSATYCDDGNDCTVDFVEADTCRFNAIADGMFCEDGDLCTLGDRCQAGQCRSGARASGELSLLGRLDNLTGKHVAMGPGRFVTVSRDEVLDARVQLVSRTEEGLATLSSWQGYLGLAVLGVNEILTHAFPDSGVVAVAAQQDRLLRLFSASETEVVPRGEVELSGQIIWLAGHGHRLWLCTRDFFTGYRITLVDLDDPDLPTEVGGIALGGSSCGSVAISEDGHRIYANTSDGVRFVDAAPLDQGGDPTLSEVIAPSAGVNVSGSHLILTTPTAVRILTESDHAEVVAIPVTRARAATLVGDRLLIEGGRAAGAGTELFVAWYDALGASGPTLLDQVVVTTHPGPPETSSFRSATDGATLIAGTRMFELTRDRLDAVKVPQLIPMRGLALSGYGLRAYVNSGAAAIDVSNIAQPVYMAGGAFGTPTPVLRIAIDDSLPRPAFVSGLGQGLEDPTRVPIDSSNYFFASPLPIQRWTLDENADLRSEDSFLLPHQGQSQLLTAGDFMYRLVRPSVPSPGARLQGYWLPAMHGGATAVPVFDLDVSASTMRGGFDVDPRSRVAVVSTEASGTSGDLAPALIFYDLRTSPPMLLDQLPTDAVYSQIRVSGDRVVAVSYNVIVFYQRGQGEVSRQVVTEHTGAQLLAFDGQVAYLGQLHLVAGASAYELVAATFGDDAPPALLIVDGIAKSLVAVVGGLAVGFETEVLTVHPHCP